LDDGCLFFVFLPFLHFPFLFFSCLFVCLFFSVGFSPFFVGYPDASTPTRYSALYHRPSATRTSLRLRDGFIPSCCSMSWVGLPFPFFSLVRAPTSHFSSPHLTTPPTPTCKPQTPNGPAAFITIYIHFTFLARKHLVQTPGTSIAHLQPGIVALGLALVVGGAEGWAFVAVWGGRWGLAAMG
jgi:hypothetical protein